MIPVDAFSTLSAKVNSCLEQLRDIASKVTEGQSKLEALTQNTKKPSYAVVVRNPPPELSDPILRMKKLETLDGHDGIISLKSKPHSKSWVVMVRDKRSADSLAEAVTSSIPNVRARMIDKKPLAYLLRGTVNILSGTVFLSFYALFAFLEIPSEDPIITGGQLRYSIGDIVDVNCTSKDSLPAANLTWYINGEPVDRSYLRQYPLEEVQETGLQSITLGLQFKVRQKHFKHGGLKIKCLATLAALYWRSDERSAEPAAMTSSYNLHEHKAYAEVSPTSEDSRYWFFNIGSGSDCIFQGMAIVTVLNAACLMLRY
ncbi:uncharacterized protein LOC136035231 [Artemia franciscana]|uniref:uncharacterized protein LOC136035231 n=1 Tax=Artemia franciscana TaxID=6661 RepID=UPI0032DA7F16